MAEVGLLPFARIALQVSKAVLPRYPLDQRILERYGVQLIAPHKFLRVAVATQDGPVLRRYRRRWKVEGLFAWLHNFRRIVMRWEYYPENSLGMIQLACAIILLRHL